MLPSMIQYVQGDATNLQGPGVKYLVHICNDEGGWGRGFVKAISARWPEPEERYRAWAGRKTDPLAGYFELGAVQFVQVPTNLIICNMVAQNGYKSEANPVPVRYDALEKCLTKVGIDAKLRRGSVHMPRLGTGLGGGTWDQVEPILQRTLEGIQVTVYDL